MMGDYCVPDDRKALETLTRILRTGGFLAVAHHGSCPAVMHDRLPEEPAIRSMFREAMPDIRVFLDEPGFYCLIANRP